MKFGDFLYHRWRCSTANTSTDHSYDVFKLKESRRISEIPKILEKANIGSWGVCSGKDHWSFEKSLVKRIGLTCEKNINSGIQFGNKYLSGEFVLHVLEYPCPCFPFNIPCMNIMHSKSNFKSFHFTNSRPKQSVIIIKEPSGLWMFVKSCPTSGSEPLSLSPDTCIEY